MLEMTLEAVSEVDYRALREGAGLQLRPTGGVLRLTDNDRVDFLQRMTTNNIEALKPGQSCVTVLTNPVARSLFAFTVLCRTEDLLLLPALHPEGSRSDALARHLRGQIFFMDAVKVEDISTQYQRARLMGPEAITILHELGVAFTGSVDGAWQEADSVIAVQQQGYDVPGFELLLPVDEATTLIEQLQSAGARRLEGESAYTARRVELGRPLSGYEITDEYSPLESGLAWTCAENKGCYTGQEIIARQITYDKVTKTLVGLTSAELLAAGDDVTVDGRKVGVVTSTAFNPMANAPRALAILKRPHNGAGTEVFVAGKVAAVVMLPFEDSA